jgi:hypothetical protein
MAVLLQQHSLQLKSTFNAPIPAKCRARDKAYDNVLAVQSYSTQHGEVMDEERTMVE